MTRLCLTAFQSKTSVNDAHLMSSVIMDLAVTIVLLVTPLILVLICPVLDALNSKIVSIVSTALVIYIIFN